MKIFPRKPLPKKGKEAGFTLIEAAVVLVVIGVIISIMAATLPLLLESAKLKQAAAGLEKIDYSLGNYLISNGRFPCPDTNGNGEENRILGSNTPLDDTCTSYVGDLPFRTLGLTNAEDPWQRTIRYGVYLDLIRTTGVTGSTSFCNVIKSVPPTPQPPAIPTKIYTTITTGGVDTNTNQAYIIVSGGDTDADNIGGFFDGLNGDGVLLQFEDGGKITLATYDDILKAASFPYLAGKECVGTQVGGIPGGGGENTFPNGCVNGKDTNGDGILDIGDDDGDGAIDCADPDCATDQACISSTQVKITGTPLPSGYLKSNYIVNIEATGGKPRYTWELLNNGGFTDFVINQYTGVITGTLNQCPGTYNTIQVKVTDSTTPTPTTDTRSFSITVNKNILINGSSAVTWSDPDWEEPYNITAGQYIGTSIGWDLTTGGATGFTVAKTGSDSAVIKKTGATTVPPYTYTFNLTATDTFPACAGPPPTNTTSKAIEVTLTAVGAAMPTRSTAVAWWRFDECLWNGTTGEVKDSNPNLLHGTATSGALTTTGVTCRGGYFDGVDDQVSVPDNNLLGFNGTTAAFSISFWIKVPTNVSGPSANIVAKGTNYVVTYDFRNGNDRITFTIGGTTLTGPTTVDLANNSWHHIAVTAGNTGTNEMKIYTDGVLMIQGNNITPASITDPLLIGGAWGPSAFFNIDEVTIYNRELSLAEVTALWNNGTPPTRTCTTCP